MTKEGAIASPELVLARNDTDTPHAEAGLVRVGPQTEIVEAIVLHLCAGGGIKSGARDRLGR